MEKAVLNSCSGRANFTLSDPAALHCNAPVWRRSSGASMCHQSIYCWECAVKDTCTHWYPHVGFHVSTCVTWALERDVDVHGTASWHACVDDFAKPDSYVNLCVLSARMSA